MSESMKDYEDQLGKEVFEEKAWKHLASLKKSNEIISVTVDGFTSGGLICFVEDIRGFIPLGQISVKKASNPEKYLGQRLDVKIIRINIEKKELILSSKVIELDRLKEEENKKIKAFEIGSIVKGTVDKITNFGAFIKINDDITGLVHVSQITDKKIETPKGVLGIGQEVEAKVIGNTNGKLSLSIKAMKELDNKNEASFSEIDMPEVLDATTSMANLFKNIKL